MLIPILVVLASIYLIVAPFYEAPLESFYCLLFILAGIPFYLVFVHFNIVPQSFFVAIGKFRFRFNLLNLLTPKGRRGVLMVSAFDSGRAVRVRALAGDIVLCSWARHFTLTVPLSTQVYKWVPANVMLGGNRAMD